MMEQQDVQSVPWWSNTVNYYNHIKNLWEDIKKARQMINEGVAGTAHKAMEDWLEAQKILVDFLSAYLSEAELKEIDENIAIIDKRTGGQQFIALVGVLDETSWLDIKRKLERNERILALSQARNSLFLQKKRIATNEEYARS